LGDQSAEGRVLRGGSWNNNQNNARVAGRNRNNPNNSNNNIGFRLVSTTFSPAGKALGHRSTTQAEVIERRRDWFPAGSI